MLFFWRFIFGYLRIKICGENCEKILNRAASNGIHIWHLRYKNGCIYGNISIKNFYKLRKLKRDIKCNITIVKKYGICFKLKNYNHRIGFYLGIIIFFVLLNILSNYIWIIKIDGNDYIHKSEIINSCKKIGITTGVNKQKINTKYDAQRLQLNTKDIAWCGINIEGCILTVNISENAISDKTERANPSNLKAGIDGKIKKVDITSGNVTIKVGDVVSKGDLLVSGVIENKNSTQFIHSEGIVIAETKRVFSANGNFVQKIDIETGKIKNRHTIEFFNLKIPLFLGNINKSHNYNSHINHLKLFNKEIPIKISKEEYRFINQKNITYNEESLIKLLRKDIQKQVDSFNFINALEDNTEITRTSNSLLLKITYICEENIAVNDTILLSKEN